jgi:ferric-dicitrate binding protein FerR (iron transport regulator)
MQRFLSSKGRAARALVLLLTAALINLSSPAPRAAVANARHAGEVTDANGVSVDGSPAVRGQTLFSGSRLEAAGNSRSLLSLDNFGRVELTDAAALRLDFDDTSFGGALEAGRLRVYAPRGVAAAFATADARVKSDSREPASFQLRSAGGFTEVSVQSGALEVRAKGSARTLKAGETYSTAPDPQTRQNLSGRKRAGLIVAVASAAVLVAIIFSVRGDEEPPGQICESGPIVPSGPSPPSTCF